MVLLRSCKETYFANISMLLINRYRACAEIYFAWVRFLNGPQMLFWNSGTDITSFFINSIMVNRIPAIKYSNFISSNNVGMILFLMREWSNCRTMADNPFRNSSCIFCSILINELRCLIVMMKLSVNHSQCWIWEREILLL